MGDERDIQPSVVEIYYQSELRLLLPGTPDQLEMGMGLAGVLSGELAYFFRWWVYNLRGAVVLDRVVEIAKGGAGGGGLDADDIQPCHDGSLVHC